MEKIEKQSKTYNLSAWPFQPCITDGSWFVMRWDVTHTDTGACAIYIFGADGVHATVYNQNNPTFRLEDLAYSTLIKHLEENPDEIETGLFRFEFDGERFNFCEEEPKWAQYDCGKIKD